MRIVVLQPAVPSYRVGLFDRLAEKFGSRFAVYASNQDMGVLTERASIPIWEHPLGPLRQFMGIWWQSGVLSIPLARGDLVVVSGAPRYLSNVAFLIKARLTGAKTIWWGHYWSSTSRSWRAALRMVLMRLSNAVLFYTDKEVDEYFASHPGSLKRVAALNNGIDTVDIISLRAPYVPQSRQRDLLFIGRLTSKTQLELLLEALADRACAGISLDVIGSGEQEGPLRRCGVELGIAERVAWHGGIADEQRIAEIANTCKAFVYPGSVGLSLIHGFAYGLPAIVHEDRWRHMPEIAALSPGRNGATFIPDSAPSLAKAISSLVSDPMRLQAMSLVAVATTEESFNVADMADRFSRMIDAVREDTVPLVRRIGEA